MKNNLRGIMVLALLVLGSAVHAQLKIGYTNAEYVLTQMPDAKEIQSQLQSHQKQLETQLQTKSTAYQNLVQEYQANQATYIDAVRLDKENEIRRMQQEIQEFQVNADASLQKKQLELLDPALKKIQDAIKAVAEKNGYSHVFSNAAGGLDILLFARDEDDITNLVLAELGIAVEAAGN